MKVKRTVRKTLMMTGSLLATCAALLLARAQAQNSGREAAAGGAAKTAAQQFKNIQVLKDAPADQIIPAMQFITASLGVDCEYCHVEHAFEKDDKKPKVTARKMMEMMMTINAENFDSHREVTCYTCHQGTPKPLSIPAIAGHARSLDASGETHVGAGNPPAESLLDRYLTAIGGAEALNKIFSRVAKGTVTVFGDQKLAVEIYAKAPNKRVSVVHTKDGESVTAYNGKVGWMSMPGRVHMMNSQESFGARMDADFAFAVNVKSLYAEWKTNDGEAIDGRETWLVTGQNQGQPPLKMYFDQQSNLLVRLVRYVDSPLGYNPTQIDYGDYRTADGVKIPYRWTVARPGNRFTVQVEQLQQNVAIDEARFVPPSPPAPPAGTSGH